MHSQYLWNVANRGQIKLTCLQVRPLLIILIPLLESIMYGKTEGSARPNAHCVFRVWRPLLERPWHSRHPSPEGSPGCQAVLWSPGWGRDKAANSTRGSQLLLGQCCAELDCLLLHRGIFTGAFWLYTSWCLKEPVDTRRVEASALQRRQQQGSP